MTTREKRRVLLTGLWETSQKVSAFLEAYDATPIIFPLQKTRELLPKVNDFYDWIIFTSPAAVRHFQSLKTVRFSKAACVGPSTEKAFLQFYEKCDLIPDDLKIEGKCGA